MNVRSCLCVVLLALAVSWSCEAVEEKHVSTRKRIHTLFEDQRFDLKRERTKHSLVEEVAQQLRSRRQTANQPVIHGDHQFTGDPNRYAIIHYAGNSSPVIIVMTYNQPNAPTSTNVYRSTDYGAMFQNITSQLSSPLWSRFYTSSTSNLVVFYHATLPKIYISNNEGATWTSRDLSPNTINPRSFVWNPRQERSAIAQDPVNDFLYVTQDLGQSWTKIAENVYGSFNYQWGNGYDSDVTTVYFNSYDPNDANRGNYTVGLYSQTAPYSAATKREFDPSLGRHDDFLLLGPYIYAQRNDSGTIHLYISYNRQPFNLAKIPTTDPHRNYYVGHINALQALVIVEHVSGKFNLYLSDITGVYFSLSLANIAVGYRGIDLELINGINGTMIANRFGATTSIIRTVITLDNGGEWNYLTPPEFNLTGAPVLCEPPACSLHFQMASSEYARLGVYSQDSAPGIIVAHGNTGTQLATNPDLYISRDGGVSWSQTLAGSWGVTVVDHGGLLVAADDYHQEPSNVLKYSCNEGLSWNNFTYIPTQKMTIFGVITEPGEETTTVSLYGVKSSSRNWDVVTVNFSTIFERLCVDSDFYQWQPWDARTESDCILGLDVTLERRLPSRCCLIGPNYQRPLYTRICQCSIDDYECDYGYQPADGVNGPCILDPAVPLDDPCADGQVKTVMKSRGYRKVAGDVCSGGEINFEPYQFTCCSGGSVATSSQNTANHGQNTASPSHVTPVAGSNSNAVVAGLSVALSVAILVALALAVLAAVALWMGCRTRSISFRRMGSPHIQFRDAANAGDDSDRLLSNDEEDDDDPPLAP